MNQILVIGFLAVVVLNWPMYRLIYWQQKNLRLLKQSLAERDAQYDAILAMALYWKAVAQGNPNPPLP